MQMTERDLPDGLQIDRYHQVHLQTVSKIAEFMLYNYNHDNEK